MGHRKGVAFRTAFETYTVEKQIGAGGSGEVYEVRDSDGLPHALKVLDPARTNHVRLKRFRNEIFFCAKNTHANIIHIEDNGVATDGSTFYVMPTYPRTLRNLMSQGIRPENVLRYFGQILDGIEAAHLLKVWHRDIKPENILHSDQTDSLIVADFGIAHFEEEELLTAVETKNNDRLANFVYSAPEQRQRGQKVEGGADVYALGLILNEMFTSAVPQGTGFRRVTEITPNYDYLDGIVEAMLSQQATARPSVAEVKQELIARGNKFISLQRLNSLRSAVIPDSEVDDPVVRNPITLKGVDYQDGTFSFTLSAPPPPNWIMLFQNPRTASWGSYLGSGPEYFGFNGDRAYVTLRSGGEPQQLVNYTKSYIDMANRQYAQLVKDAHQKRLEEQREELRRGVEAEEKRQKVLSGLKI